LRSESLHAILSQAAPHRHPSIVAHGRKMVGGDVPAARGVLDRASVANLESRQIWLAPVKLEAENGKFNVSRQLLVRARAAPGTERVTSYLERPCHAAQPYMQIWMKSAVFTR
jgi:pre-mRNA-processing factor 6